MIEFPNSIKRSREFVRRLLLSYFLGSTALIGLTLAAIDLVERHRELIHEGEQATHVVASSMVTPMPDQVRQSLLKAYVMTSHDNRLDGMNLLLVLNRFGRIAYSSRPELQGLHIGDPLISQLDGKDQDFHMVVNCFRRQDSDCINLRSADLRLRTRSFTVVRSVQKPSTDLGIPREPFLVLANFNNGVVMADFLQDLIPLSLVSLLLASLLTGALWLALLFQLLPRLHKAAQTDGLTQLINRASFMETAMNLLADGEERHEELVFAILDIDHFKRINDTYGHDCGDMALASFATVLSTVLRPDDLVCRFGGEEFALLLSSNKESGRKALERLRLQLEMSRVAYNGHQLAITASIGAASTADCGYNVDYLYTSADKALYAAKSGGRNRVEFSDAESLSRLQLMH